MHRRTGFSRKALIASVFFVGLTAGASVASASLTFNGTSINGDSNSTVDATGTVTIGGISATGITIGRGGVIATIPGGLTITSLGSTGSPCLTVSNTGAVATTTCGSGGSTTTIDGLTNAAFTIAAGANITITTSSPGTITISAAGASSTNPTINGITSSTFTFAAGSGLSVASSANPNLITFTFANPGFPTAASSVTWTALQTLIGGATFNSTSTHNSSTLLIGQTAVGTSTLNGALNILGAVNQAGGVVSIASTTIIGNATTTNLAITALAGQSGCLSISASGQVTTSTCSGGSLSGGQSNYFALWTGASSLGTSTLSISGNTLTNSGNENLGGNLNVTGTVNFAAAATFNATATFLGPIVESSTGAGSIELTEGTCPSGVSGADILCANSAHTFQSSLNGGSYVAVPQLAGDLGNTAASPKVTGIQGVAVSSTAPSSNQCLVYNGSTWAPGSCGGGGGGSVTTSSAITATDFPFWSNTTGGLSGTSTLSISGNTLTNSGNSNIGGTLNVTSTATFNATTTFLGAIQGGSTSSTEGMQILEGLCPATSTGSDILCAASSTHSFQISLNGGSYASVPELTGDLGGAAASPTVVGLQGRAVSSTAPSTNQVLTWNGATWAPANTGSGITAINGLSNATTSIVAGSNITITTSSPNTITIAASGGGGSSTWNSMTNPTGNLSLSMGTYTTTFTAGTSTTNPFLIQDTTGNTATSALFEVSTVGTSTASPVEFTAQGNANGVKMNSSSTLSAIGTGNINATQIQGFAVSTSTPSTNQVLTYNGTAWAPANASGTGGGGGGSVTTSSAITANNFPFWANTTGGLSGTSTLSVSGNTVTNSGNEQIGGTLNVTSTATLQATTTILGNVALGTSTLTSGANLFASFGTSGTTTLMLGATTTAGTTSGYRAGCLEMVAGGGASSGTNMVYVTFQVSSSIQMLMSTSTCL